MPWYVAVYELLVRVSLAGCVLLGLASIAVWLLREPARKIRVIELALAGLLALPAVVLIPGYPRVAVLPERSEASSERILDQPAALPHSDAAQSNSDQPPALPGGRAEQVVPINDPQTVTTKSPPAKPGAEQGARGAHQPPDRATESRATGVPPVRTGNDSDSPNKVGTLSALSLPTDYRLWIVLAYLSGVTVMLGWSLLGWVALRRLIASAQPADESTRSLFRDVAGSAGDRVRLLVSARAAQPCAFGWRRPTIVLPESLVAVGDARQLRFALAHEWSHVVRGDLASWTLAGVARAVHFLQPLVWLLRRQLRLSQVFLADAAGTGTPEDYAEFLTNVSQAFKRPKLAPGLGIAARRSDLHRRVVMLVENARPLESIVPRRWNAVILFASSIAIAAVATLRAEQEKALPEVAAAATHSSASEPSDTKDVPPELRPERIRENMRKHSAVEHAVLDDPVLRELRQQLLELSRQQSTVPLEETTPPDRRIPHSQMPNVMPYARILKLQERIKKREAEVREKAMHQAQADGPPDDSSASGLPPEVAVDRELEKDLAISRLSEKLRAYQGHLDRVRGSTSADGSNEYIGELQREILRLEEEINERKHALRPEVVKDLSAGASARTHDSDLVLGTHAPFSGKIRPGDILNIEIVGGFPGAPVPPRTVEPDGNVALTAAYGTDRIAVAGKSLIEAGEMIETRLRELLKEPSVLVTYAGHDDGVVAVDQAGAAATSNAPAASEEVVLKTLDTIEVTLGAKMNNASFPIGTYLIEPDGRVGLAATRLKLAGLTEREAGAALRAYMSEQPWLRKAPPSIHVVQRGRAVFPADKTPTAEYRVRAGDQLLLNASGSAADGMSREVSSDGTLSYPSPFVGQELPTLRVEGMTIDELQQAVRESWKFPTGGGTIQQSNLQQYPWSVTFGGWREEANPDVIDRIENADGPRVERLEQELLEIKTMIRGLSPR